jgi:polyhydroxybutyrate depolymerase
VRWGPLICTVASAAIAACDNGGTSADDDGDDDGTSIDAAGGATTDAATTTIDAPAAVTCEGKSTQPLDSIWMIEHAGMTRTIRVHVPASYDPARPTPVVLDFHGYTMSAQAQEDMTRLPAKSDAAGFISVTPDGTGSLRGWNAGACCGTPAQTGLDDVGFVNLLLDQLEARLCVDTRRVFATGFSNGGFLSHRLACEASTRIAAIAPVAGMMGIDDCNPTRAVPVLHFHGTADTIVPYAGGGASGFRSAADTDAGWAMRNGCDAATIETFARGDSRCVSHAGCDGGSEVTLCTITGGGHTWPGGGYFPGGHITTDLSATDAMWAFFAAHPMP